MKNQKSELSQQIGQEIKSFFVHQSRDKPGDKQLIINKLGNLKKAQQMLLNKQIQSGLPDRLDKFQNLLNLPKNRMQGLKQWMNHIKFCLTIYPSLKISTKISQILLLHITQSQKMLDMVLQQITSKEQMKKINAEHSQDIAKQRKKFNQQLQRMKQKIIKQRHALIQQARQQRQQFKEQMMGSQIQHQAEIEVLRSQILTADKERQKKIEERIELMKTQHKSEIEKLQNQISQNSKGRQNSSDLTAKMEQIRTQHNRELESLKQQLQTEINKRWYQKICLVM